MASYHRELLKFNKTINLVSSRSLPDADRLHFADSILGAQIVLNDSAAGVIHDLGSGNGFPGMIIGILAPAVELVLVESDRRKAEFLKHTAATLGLRNVSVLVSRVEEIEDESLEGAVCRGFANLPKTLLKSRKLLPVGGKLYSFKGPEWSFEIAQMPEQICSTWNTQLLADYMLPESDIQHSIVVASKTR